MHHSVKPVSCVVFLQTWMPPRSSSLTLYWWVTLYQCTLSSKVSYLEKHSELWCQPQQNSANTLYFFPAQRSGTTSMAPYWRNTPSFTTAWMWWSAPSLTTTTTDSTTLQSRSSSKFLTWSGWKQVTSRTASQEPGIWSPFGLLWMWRHPSLYCSASFFITAWSHCFPWNIKLKPWHMAHFLTLKQLTGRKSFIHLISFPFWHLPVGQKTKIRSSRSEQMATAVQQHEIMCTHTGRENTWVFFKHLNKFCIARWINKTLDLLSYIVIFTSSITSQTKSRKSSEIGNWWFP